MLDVAAMPDYFPPQLLLATFAGWVNREQAQVVAYLGEENRVLREQLHGRLAFVSPMVSAAGWPPRANPSDGDCFTESPPSSRPTRSCGGTCRLRESPTSSVFFRFSG